MSLRCRSLWATLPFTLCALGLAQPALAQTADEERQAPAATESEPEEIIVTGSYARSLAAATETKRQAAYGVDSINSTDIGKFPTQNVAEALQLVTGVAITRPRGEGLYVSVRGLGPQFQSTMLNGRNIAINDLIENGGANGRQFRFEMLPAEFVSQIDVVKTPTADMTEGALGGNIDVKTFQPLDVGTKTTLNLRGTYTTLTEKVKPNATALTSFRNADETLGLLIGAQYWAKEVRNDRWYNNGWTIAPVFASTLGPGYYTPTRTRPTIETENRERFSGLISAQWRPSDELETTFDVLGTRLDVAYDEFGLDIYPEDTSVAGHRPTIVPGSVKLDGNTVVAATINDVRFMGTREYSLNRHDLLSIGLKQSWKPEGWDVTANTNWSYAHSFHPSNAVGTVRSRIQFFAPLTYDASGGYKVIPTFTTPTDPTDPANFVLYPFNVAPKNSKDWDWYSRLDVGHEMPGFLSKIAAGGEYHWRKRDYRRRDFTVNPGQVPLTSFAPNGYETIPYDDFLSDVPGNAPRTWIVPITGVFYDKLFTDAVANAPLAAGDLRASYVVSEKTASGYVRADYAFPLGGIDVTGNVGVRYVHTDQVASGTLTIGTAPTPASFPKTFNNWLPSFNLRAELSPTLVARLAASRVLTRPNVTQSAPQISVSTDAPTGSGGNPELVPFLATQFDGSLEWYFSRRGSLTGALFYKAMDDYITAQNINVEIPGRGTILLSTQVNGGNAKVYGVEAAYNQVFTFLPKPLDGLGVQASYTHTSVQADYTAGARTIKDQLIGLSKNSFNVVGFYDYGPISARLSYVWRDRYLSGTGSTTQTPSYIDAFGSLDGNLSFRVTDKTMLSLEAINIAGARQYSYSDEELRFNEIHYWGRTILFGVRTEF
jgi:TonB-dependent receptor